MNKRNHLHIKLINKLEIKLHKSKIGKEKTELRVEWQTELLVWKGGWIIDWTGCSNDRMHSKNGKN